MLDLRFGRVDSRYKAQPSNSPPLWYVTKPPDAARPICRIRRVAARSGLNLFEDLAGFRQGASLMFVNHSHSRPSLRGRVRIDRSPAADSIITYRRHALSPYSEAELEVAGDRHSHHLNHRNSGSRWVCYSLLLPLVSEFCCSERVECTLSGALGGPDVGRGGLPSRLKQTGRFCGAGGGVVDAVCAFGTESDCV